MKLRRLFIKILLLHLATCAAAASPLREVDREAYDVYIAALRTNENGNRTNWPKVMLIKDEISRVVADDKPCHTDVPDPGKMTFIQRMILRGSTRHSPAIDIQPPTDKVEDFNQMLADYDERCHEALHLANGTNWLPEMNIHLLSAEEQKAAITYFSRYKDRPSDSPFAGATGIISLSNVYFNRTHTLAMLYYGRWCGNLCASWGWEVYEKKEGRWVPSKGWNIITTVS